MADEAASRRAYDDALAWLGVVQAIGDELPGAYERKREAWRAQLNLGGLTSPAVDARELHERCAVVPGSQAG